MKARAALSVGVLCAASCHSPAKQTADAAVDAASLDLPSIDLPSTDLSGTTPRCPPNRSTHVRALIGPDVDVRLACTTNMTFPLATVDVEDDGSTQWSVSVTNDRLFVLQSPVFVTCQANSPTLAAAVFEAPGTAGPGTTFDAVATVSSDDGSFPTGQVNLHAEVVAPAFTLDRTSIDFGEVLPDQTVAAVATATSEFAQASALPESVSSGFFQFQTTQGGSIAMAKVSFTAHDPGDYTATWIWTAGTFRAPNCTTSKPIALHARVVAADGGATDGGDASADGE